MDQLLMISDLAWIRRGVAKSKPDKIKLDDQQMKELIFGGVPESTDMDGSDGSDNEAETEKPGLRGSAKHMEVDDGEGSIEKYVEGYDNEAEDNEKGMRGIAMYTTNKDDPYVTEHVNSDEEEEKEEYEIKPDDNMVAVAKIHKDEFTMEIYVFNESSDDWYCHHDYILDAPPLCLEPIQHDPGNDETGRGNLIAVGTMESTINIWDLDIVNAVEPVVTLGSKSAKRKKRDASQHGHSDAVISLAWNKLTTHVLASGGADKKIVLWDLDQAKPAQLINRRGGEVQSIAWHPSESTCIMAGMMSGDVQVIDCREVSGSVSVAWKFDAQVEKVQWDHFNPFGAYLATDDGMLHHVDTRNSGKVLWEGRAHEESIGGLSLSSLTKGLLMTVGLDHMFCIWKVNEDSSITKVHSEKLHIGALHAAQFNPDVSTVCVIGGSSEDLIKVVDVSKISAVVEAFS